MWLLPDNFNFWDSKESYCTQEFLMSRNSCIPFQTWSDVTSQREKSIEATPPCWDELFMLLFHPLLCLWRSEGLRSAMFSPQSPCIIPLGITSFTLLKWVLKHYHLSSRKRNHFHPFWGWVRFSLSSWGQILGLKKEPPPAPQWYSLKDSFVGEEQMPSIDINVVGTNKESLLYSLQCNPVSLDTQWINFYKGWWLGTCTQWQVTTSKCFQML